MDGVNRRRLSRPSNSSGPRQWYRIQNKADGNQYGVSFHLYPAFPGESRPSFA